MENALNKKAMLVDLSIKCWYARKHDRKVTEEVAEAHQTRGDVGRYNKNLLPVDALSYDTVRRLVGEIRLEHYRQTLPWSNDGARILPAVNYLQYMEIMREKRGKFERAVKEFLVEYPGLRENAKEQLKTLYQAEDYPQVGRIEQLFGVSVKVFPLPAGEDFRVSLAGGDAEAIREQIEKDTRETVVEAMREPYRRLHVVVARMAERLGDPKGKFKDSLVSNIEELCDLLPSLNLTGDPEMGRMTDLVRSKLAGHDPDDLRDDAKLRKQVAEEARRIGADLAAFMGGGG